jgi:hypothetical protein
MKIKDKEILLNEFMDWLDPSWNTKFFPRLMYCAVLYTNGDWKESRYQLVKLFLKTKGKKK